MQLISSSLTDGAAIDLAHAELSAGGQNLSPALAWSGAPEGTRSYAVTCYDPDAPTGSGWWHWIGFDIPATITELHEGAELPGREWANDYGYAGYGGPCPPPGPAHRYVFTVHALDCEELGVGDEMTQASVRFTLLAHAIDQASITSTFALPDSEQL